MFIDIPLDPHALRAAELLAPPPEIIDQYRPLLWQKVEQVLATTVNPHERDAVLRTARFFDWHLFYPRQPLPEGLVLTKDHNQDGTRIAYDSREGFWENCFSAATERLEGVGLKKEILDPFKQYILSQGAAARAAWEASLADSPEAALIRAFDIEQPVDLTEQPLPEQERSEREQRIIRQARQRHALADWERMQRRTQPAAVKSMSRGVQWLDEETLPRPEEAVSNDDAVGRARAYFRPLVAEAFKQIRGSGSITDFFIDEYGALCVASDIEPEGDEAGLYLGFTAEVFVQETSPDLSSPMHLARTAMVHAFLRELFNPSVTRSYKEIVGHSVRAASAKVLKATADLEIFHFDVDDETYQLRLWQPGEYVEHSENEKGITRHSRCEFYEANSTPGFVSAREIGRNRRMTIGRVRSVLPPGPARLIQTTMRDKNVPLDSDDIPDLVVELWSDDFTKADPYIPGYRLVSRDWDVCRFVRAEEGDPYAPIDVALNDGQRHRLQEAYTSAGFEALAAFVRDTPHLTVEQLCDAIRAHGDYIVPDQDAMSNLPRNFIGSTLEEFAVLLADGRLRGQCSIFSKFYQLSLEAAFGNGAAVMATGHVLDDTVITAERHRQVVFTYNGRVYISDATPFADRVGEKPREPAGVYDTYRPEAPPVTRFAAEDIPAIREPVPIDPAARRRQLLANTRAALEAQLTVVLRVPDTAALYEAVVRLPAHDPVRQTLELVIAATRDGTPPAQVYQLWRYLRQTGAADRQTLRNLGLRVYDPQLLGNMQDVLGQIAQACGYPPPGVGMGHVVSQLEQIVSSLPHAELAVAAASLARAIRLMAGTAQQPDINTALQAAHILLERVYGQIRAGTTHLEQYRDSIT